MAVPQIIEELNTALKSLNKITNFNSREFICRCPYCGDSTKSEFSMHLYISLSHPHPFYCQRCNTGGAFLSSELLSLLEVFDDNVVKKVLTIQKNVIIQGIPKSKYSNFTQYKWKYPKLDTSTWTFNQAYKFLLREKMDVFFNDYELLRYKVIFSLDDFLELNNLTNNRNLINKRLLESLNSYYIGFVNLDGSHIVFRNISDNVNRMRYYNYNLVNSDETNIVYGVSKTIDLSNHDFTLVISEGILDLIQIERLFYYTHINNLNYYAMATNGFGLVNTLKYFIHRFGLFPKNVFFFIDNDPPKLYKDKYYDNLSSIKLNLQKFPFTKNLNIAIYQNSIDKDFGLPSGRIQLNQVY